MITDWFVAPAVGAVIGYCTNWLAIKMLFKPYRKYKIKGVPIPFTPGVIPKERKRIANKLGEVVEGHLLTEDVIMNELLSSGVKKSVIDSIFNKLFNNKQPSSEVEGLLEQVYPLMGNKIMELISDNREPIIDYLTKIVVEQLKNTNIKDIMHHFNHEIDSVLIHAAENGQLKGNIKEQLYHSLDSDKTLNSFVDQPMSELISSLIKANLPKGLEAVNQLLASESVKEKGQQLIANTIKEKIGPLGAMFVNAESIYETVVRKFNEMIEQEETIEAIEIYLNDAVEQLLDKKISDIVDENDKATLINLSIDKIFAYLSTLSLVDLVSLSIGDSKSIYDFIDDTKIDVTQFIRQYISNVYEQFINRKGVQEQLLSIIKRFVNQVRNNWASEKDDIRQKLEPALLQLYEQVVKTQVKPLLEDVKIGTMVEKQINTFDIVQLEDILLTIVNKELKAITWFGAILGFVMGFIVLFVQN